MRNYRIFVYFNTFVESVMVRCEYFRDVYIDDAFFTLYNLIRTQNRNERLDS